MEKKDLKIVFYGTPDFAVETLKTLVDRQYQVVAVVTAPDKPAGRGKKITSSPVKQFALKHKIPVLQPVKLKDPDFLKTLKQIAPDLQIVVAFRMLPTEVWSLPPLGTFNLHASLLPQYRGASPINYALINGERRTGLTTFFIDDRIDTGNILLQKQLPIEEDDTFETLHDKMMKIGADLVVETVEGLLKGELKPIPQKEIENGSTLKTAPKIKKEDCHINWNQEIDKIYNFIRGLSPWPGAYTYFVDESGKKYYAKIFKTKKIDEKGRPGDVETDHQNYLKVFGKDGALLIEELQLAGKKRMKTVDFLRGFKFSGKIKAQ